MYRNSKFRRRRTIQYTINNISSSPTKQNPRKQITNQSIHPFHQTICTQNTPNNNPPSPSNTFLAIETRDSLLHMRITSNYTPTTTLQIHHSNRFPIRRYLSISISICSSTKMQKRAANSRRDSIQGNLDPATDNPQVVSEFWEKGEG